MDGLDVQVGFWCGLSATFVAFLTDQRVVGAIALVLIGAVAASLIMWLRRN
jgi:hypothetical protein